MKEKGLTLMDVITLGIILLILGFLAVPHVMAGRSKAREALVRANMHTLQLAAEDFATLANGRYPVNLATTVQQACASCTGDSRYIANSLIPPYGVDALLQDDFINPYLPINNALFNDGTPATRGITHFFDFGASGNSAQGYSIRGVGLDNTQFMSLVLTSYR